MTPEELARARAYYGGEGISSPAAPTIDPASYYGPPSPPAEPGGIDPSWLGGQQPPPGTAMPAFDPSRPDALFGGPAPAPSPQGPVTLEDAIGQANAGAPPPTLRDPISFERGEPAPPDEGPRPGEIGPPPAPPAPKPVLTGTGGGRDPFGIDKARKGLRGTYDQDIDAIQRGSMAERGRAGVLADGAATLAREKEEDAAIARLEAEEANRGFREYQAETQRQVDLIREKRINPSVLFPDAGSKAMAIAGGVLGGFYMGLNRLTKNPFIEDLNRSIDRFIAVEEKNLQNQKDVVAERRGILAEQRAIFKDEQSAKLQARNLYYEGAKEQIAAEAARYDDPAIAAKADQAIAAVNREQSKLDLDGALKKAAEAKAAAAAKAALEERRRKAALEERKMRVEEAEVLIKASAKNDAGDKEHNHRLGELSKEMSKPDLVAAKKLIDDLKPKMMNYITGEVDGSRRVPGTGPWANARDSWWNKPLIGGADNPIPGLGLSEEERVGRQNWDRLGLSYRRAITGAGGSNEEAEKIEKAFQGANTPAEQANAIRQGDDSLAEQEARILAGYPDVAEEYKARVAAERAKRPQTVKREPVQ